jgi:hypothetical protein
MMHDRQEDYSSFKYSHVVLQSPQLQPMYSVFGRLGLDWLIRIISAQVARFSSIRSRYEFKLLSSK